MPLLALTAHFRQCQVIEGEQGVCFTQARALLAQTDELTCLWVSSHPCISKAVPAKKVHTLLLAKPLIAWYLMRTAVWM